MESRPTGDVKPNSYQYYLSVKELWQVEQAFRDIKSIFETRPVFHKGDETIKGHV